MRAAAPAGRARGVRSPARRRLSSSALWAHLRVPQYRDGYALVLNTGLTSLLGLVYWLVAARRYSPHSLGLNSGAISAMMFLAGISQLNLMSALMRFLPVSGRKSTRFVVSSYLLSGAIAAVVALGFLLGVHVWAPALDFLSSSPGFALWFVAATVAWCIFNLQDSILIALRAAVLVPAENLVFSLVKIALLVALVEASPRYGIFASWTAALVASLLPVNALIFRRFLPRHVRAQGARARPPTRRQLARYVSADYLGALFWLAATTLMPVIVVAIEGGTANAYFSLAWMIALPLFAISASTGASLVVTASRDEAGLPRYARQALIQTAGIVIPVAVGLALAAPYVLRAFGAAYADHAATTLSLLVLSAIPNALTALYVSNYRVRRRMSAVVAILGSLCGLVLTLGVILLDAIGITGVGLAWLIAESAVACALLLVDPHALWPRAPGRAAQSLISDTVSDLVAHLRRARAARRQARDASEVAAEILGSREHRPVATVSDMSVIAIDGSSESPPAVIKCSTSALAAKSLRRERDVLAALHADERLGDWRRLVPAALAEGELGGRRYLVQSMLRGAPADGAGSGTLDAAAQAIRELHVRSATTAVVDAAALARWVDEPMLAVHGARTRTGADSREATRLDRLSAELRDVLSGRALAVSWVHGDFCPNNILVADHGEAVTGIVDWEQGAPADPPAIDAVSLLLTARAQRERRQLGDVVVELATGAQWTASEQSLLDSEWSGLPGERIDDRSLVLLWWLRHVAANLSKSTRYRARGLWARWNVRAVLDGLERGWDR